MKRDAPLLERFLAKIDKNSPGQCWIWTGSRTADGYGRIQVELGRNNPRAAHRVSYELFVGPIPLGLDLHHRCINPPCVNPDHLQPMTHQENLLVGGGFAGVHARKTHCPKGHPLTEGNLLKWQLQHRGQRNCRTCDLARQRANYLRRKAAR